MFRHLGLLCKKERKKQRVTVHYCTTVLTVQSRVVPLKQKRLKKKVLLEDIFYSVKIPHDSPSARFPLNGESTVFTVLRSTVLTPQQL